MPFAKAVADVECTPGVVCWAPIAGPLLQQQEHREVAPTQQRPQTARGLVMNQQSWRCIDCLNQCLAPISSFVNFGKAACLPLDVFLSGVVYSDTFRSILVVTLTRPIIRFPSPHLFPSPIDTLTSWRGCTCKQVTLSSILVD